MNLLNDLIVNWCSHGESTAREVWVKVLPIHKVDTRWRVTVTRQQVVNVVLTTVPEKRSKRLAIQLLAGKTLG